MIFNDILILITTITSAVAGGGWFVNYKLNKHKNTVETANLQMDFFVKRIDYLEERLTEAYKEIAELRSIIYNEK